MFWSLVVRQRRMVIRFSTKNKNTNSILEKTMAETSNFLSKIRKISGEVPGNYRLHFTIKFLLRFPHILLSKMAGADRKVQDVSAPGEREIGVIVFGNHSTIPVLWFQCQKNDLARFMETAPFHIPAFVQVGKQIVTACFRLSFPSSFLSFFYHS